MPKGPLRREEKADHEKDSWDRFADTFHDPLVRVIPVDASRRILKGRILAVQAALLYMIEFGVPAKEALRLAKACGDDGPIAYQIVGYDAKIAKIYGERAERLSMDDFMRHMRTGPRVLTRAGYDVERTGVDPDFEGRVLTLRTCLRAAARQDVVPEDIEKIMSLFGEAGKCAYVSEDYKAAYLSRRERARR